MERSLSSLEWEVGDYKMQPFDLREDFMKLDVDPVQYLNPGWEPFKRESMEVRVMEEKDLRLHITEPQEG